MTAVIRRLTRTVLVLGVLTISLMLIVWLLWIPSAQEPAYRFVHSWGTAGDGPAQFQDPTGIAVTAEEVFVSDGRNGRIQVFDHQGHFKRQFGEHGEGANQLGRPMNLSIHNNEIYVADYWNDRIQVYSLAGIFQRNIGSSGDGPGQFNAPGGVAINSNGELYVADFVNQRIQHLKADGTFIRQWGTTGKVGIAAEQFNYPTDVALSVAAGTEGQIIVADGYNDRLQAFNAEGQYLRKWGGPLGMNIHGPFQGWFATVTSVAVGPDGSVFAADFYHHRIQKFSLTGEFLTAFGEQGKGAGQFEYVMAVAVAPNGTLFATDLGNNRVLSFEPVNEQGNE